MITWLDEFYPLSDLDFITPPDNTNNNTNNKKKKPSKKKNKKRVDEEEEVVPSHDQPSSFRNQRPLTWINRSVSCITSQQQLTGFDCGVACLLYAEKLACGQSIHQIDVGTTQQEITNYREILQNFSRNIHGQPTT